MDCSLPGSIHGIFQARVLEWGAISFSRGSSLPRDPTRVSHIAGRHFTIWATDSHLFEKYGRAYNKNYFLEKNEILNIGSFNKLCSFPRDNSF